MCQQSHAGDVADPPETVAEAQMSIDREAVRVGLNANSLEADAVDARTPSGRHEEVVAALLAAIVELQDVVIGITACPDDAASQHELDTVSPHRLGERLAERGRFAGDEPRRALHDDDLTTQAAHRLRHLDADRSAPQHEQTAWDGFHP